MVDPNREPLEGVVEVDQAEIPFREGDAIFEPGNAGKILVIGAVEVIDRGSNQAKPRRKHAKYLDTRSGRLRLAVIADNSAACRTDALSNGATRPFARRAPLSLRTLRKDSTAPLGIHARDCGDGSG
jgi:hypothetical protein